MAASLKCGGESCSHGEKQTAFVLRAVEREVESRLQKYSNLPVFIFFLLHTSFQMLRLSHRVMSSLPNLIGCENKLLLSLHGNI